MIPLTAAYFLRLAAWGLLLAGAAGVPVRLSWRWWERRLAGADVRARHRLAGGHFLMLLFLPGAVAGSIHLALAAMGTEISRAPARVDAASVMDGPGSGWLPLTVVAVWAAGVFLATARLVFDAWQLRYPPRTPAPTSLADEVRRLERHLPGGRLTVRVADVPVPRVTGLVRPTLVVPAGFAHLPAAEREAVLLHELAHVARQDFAANLWQRLALAALWFQPAARAMYRQLSREREACCDRWAVEHGASAPALARALVLLAERHAAPTVALAASGQGCLRWRVQRLLAAGEALPGPPLRWVAGLGMLALAAGALGGAQLAAADAAMTDLYIASALGPVVLVSAHDPGGAFGLRIRRGRVLAATVEDRPLPPAGIRQRGDRVTLLGAATEPVVSFRVTPSGRIRWQARPAASPHD